MKILCLFVRHGTERYPEALTLLNEWYERHGLMDQRMLWIIDNARASDAAPEQLGPSTLLRSGDNHTWEFSAWSLALRQAHDEGMAFDVVHFVTSAFNTLYTEYLKHFQRDMLSYLIARNTCLGHIDSYPKPVHLGTTVSQSWIRTCFFFLTRPAAFSISSWVAHHDKETIFSSPTSRQFRPDAPLSSDYQTHITNWLEGQDMGGHTWHSPVNHGAEENIRFQQKTLAILNEHQLAITMRAAGIKLVDFCWLFSLSRTPSFPTTEPIPEAEQLKFRRKVLGIPE